MTVEKMHKNFPLVFMGTPDFAVASLQELVERGLQIVAVVTTPDKPAGRGMQVQKSAVKIFAEKNNIPVLQPVNLKAPGFADELKKINAVLQVVVAFRMLPEIIWNMPPMGTINLHASLLPQYRGAAPINHAIMNGEKETGVTIFKLKHAIDTGNILAREKIQIGKNETAGELYDRMKISGAKLLADTILKMEKNELLEIPQEKLIENISLKPAPKIFKKDTEINWNENAGTIFNLIRGLSPYPAAHTVLQEKSLKIFTAGKEIIQHNEQPGEVFTDGKTFLKYACNDGFIHALELQWEGKKRMNVSEFLKGFRAK